MDKEGLKITLDIDDDVFIKAWEQTKNRIMQVYALPPHVLRDNQTRTERDYLTEYLQEERRKMYAGIINRSLRVGDHA